jgi:hypothetical protein
MAALSAAGRRSNVSSPSHSPTRTPSSAVPTTATTTPPLLSLSSNPSSSSNSSSSNGSTTTPAAPQTPNGTASTTTTGFAHQRNPSTSNGVLLISPALAAAATSQSLAPMTYDRLSAEVRKLPADHHVVLSYILHLLTKVVANVKVNKMDSKNCGMVFGPNLIRSPRKYLCSILFFALPTFKANMCTNSW